MAGVLAHIPDPRRRLVHYYGAYSNVARGKAKASGHAAKAQPLAPGPVGEPSPPSPALAAPRRRWAQLIRRPYQVDNLGAVDVRLSLEEVEELDAATAHPAPYRSGSSPPSSILSTRR